MSHRLGLSLVLVASWGSFGTTPTDPPGASADASIPDSAAPVDGPNAVPFCPRPDAWICDDFEGPAGFRFPWQTDDTKGVATVAVREIAGAPSPTHALVAATPLGQAEDTDAFVFATTPSPVEVLRMEARLQVVDSGENAILLGFDVPENQTLRLLTDGRIIEQLRSDAGTRTNTLGKLFPFVPGPWTHVIFTVDFNRREGSATLGELTVPFHLDASWGPTVVEVRFGLNDASPEKSWSVNYDNITVATQ